MRDAVEAFLADHPDVAQRAADILRSQPEEVQRIVLEKGTVADARNPSGALISRINATAQKLGINSRGGGPSSGRRGAPEGFGGWGGGGDFKRQRFEVDDEVAQEVERFLERNAELVGAKAADIFRRQHPEVQRRVLERGSLDDCQNPSGALVSRVNKAAASLGMDTSGKGSPGKGGGMFKGGDFGGGAWGDKGKGFPGKGAGFDFGFNKGGCGEDFGKGWGGGFGKGWGCGGWGGGWGCGEGKGAWGKGCGDWGASPDWGCKGFGCGEKGCGWGEKGCGWGEKGCGWGEKGGGEKGWGFGGWGGKGGDEGPPVGCKGGKGGCKGGGKHWGGEEEAFRGGDDADDDAGEDYEAGGRRERAAPRGSLGGMWR